MSKDLYIMIRRGVTKALSLFSSPDDPHGSSIGTYLETHSSELVGQFGAWRQSVACKPLVGSIDDISTWVHSSWNYEAIDDTWTTLGGPIALEVLGSLSSSGDVKCRKGVVKALISMLLTSNSFEQENEYETMRRRKDNIKDIVPNLCVLYQTELRSVFSKILKTEERQRNFRSEPFSKFVWTICPDELLEPTMALLGEVELSNSLSILLLSQLEKVEKQDRQDMTTPLEIWSSLHFVKLIEKITTRESWTEDQATALMTLSRLVGHMTLRLPQLPGASCICEAGPHILRYALDKGVESIYLTHLCPDAFRESYCFSQGSGHHEDWFPNELIPIMNWPILVDVVIKSQTQENRDCFLEIQGAVSSAFISAVVARNVPILQLKDESIERFSSKYLELCPLLTIPSQHQSHAWYLFHMCNFNQELVCSFFDDSWTTSQEEKTYAGLKADFGISNVQSIKEFVKATNFIHIVNSVDCKQKLLLTLDRLLQEIDPVHIIDLRKSLDPDLGSGVHTICSGVGSDYRYVNVFCDEERVQDIVDDPVQWTALWKKYGFQDEALCQSFRRFDCEDMFLKLGDGSSDVSAFLLKDLALEALIDRRDLVCPGEDEGGIIAMYSAILVSHTIQANWKLIQPRSDWDVLSRAAAPLCAIFAHGEARVDADTIFAARLCPDHLKFTLVEAMRRHIPPTSISTFCEWLNPESSSDDSILNRYCADNCYLLTKWDEAIPNEESLGWLQLWGKCGSQLDLIEIFIAGTTSPHSDWFARMNRIFQDIIEMNSDEFNTFVDSVLKNWTVVDGYSFFVDFIGDCLDKGFRRFIGSLSEKNIDYIDSFCLNQESTLTMHPRRYGVMCENLPLSIDDVASALYWEDKDKFCRNYEPRTSKRQQLKYQVCELKCHLLISHEMIGDLSLWVPLWKQCGSPPQSICRISRKSSVIPNLKDFIDNVLLDWTPIPQSGCSDDFLANIAQVASTQLDWRSERANESQRSVIHEFCHKEHDFLSIFLPTAKQATVFLAAECDNLPISFETLRLIHFYLEIPAADICSHMASDKRRERISEFCSDPDCFQLGSITDIPSWTELWLKCQTPADPICGLLDQVSTQYRSMNTAVHFALQSPLSDRHWRFESKIWLA